MKRNPSGSPFDRGAADSYYSRPRRPHFYRGPTISSERVEAKDMTPDEIDDYHAGYDWNEEQQLKKDWGDEDTSRK